MQKGDTPAPGAPTRLSIDEPVARGATALERSVEIGHSVADVVNAGAAPGEELRYGTCGVPGLEQLDLHVAQSEADDRRAIGGFGKPKLQDPDVPGEGQGGGDARHGDGDGGDAGGGGR